MLAACGGLYGGWSLHNLVTRAAAVLGPDGAHDPPLHRGDIKLFGSVIAQLAQRPAAIGASACPAGRFGDNVLAGQMSRQRVNRPGPVGLWRN